MLCVLLLPAEHGNNKNGTDTKMLCGSEIDTWIGCGIDGNLGLTGLQAGPGESVSGIEGQAEAGGKFSSCSSADRGIATGERQRGSSRGSRGCGPGDKLIQYQIEREVRRKTSEKVLL